MGNKAFSDALTFTRASSGSYYAANGALRIAATNEPRYDYDPVTLAMRGILIEEARSNLLLYSNYFDNAVSWNKTTSTIASNAAISPDGTMSASFMTATAGGGRVTQIAAATATSLIFSVCWDPICKEMDGCGQTIVIFTHLPYEISQMLVFRS